MKRPNQQMRTARTAAFRSYPSAARQQGEYLGVPSGQFLYADREDGGASGLVTDGVESVLQVDGGALGQGTGAGVHAAGHVRGEQGVPLFGAGQLPCGELFGVEVNSCPSLSLGDQAAVEEVVDQRRATVGLFRYPVDGQQPARRQVDAKFLLDFTPDRLQRLFPLSSPPPGISQVSVR